MKKNKFSVVLSCLADGTKLIPMIIFKRKNTLSVKFPSGVFVHVHEKGWMDEVGIKLWIKNISSKRLGELRKEKSLLMCDMFRSHLTDSVKATLKRNDTVSASIY